MKEKKTPKNGVEKSMACTAFAEAGEPCPLDVEDKKNAPQKSDNKPPGAKATSSSSIENTMACTAFGEAGEPCPLDTKKSAKTTAKKQ